MHTIYADLRREAVKIAARYPTPDFYRFFSRAVSRSRALLRTGHRDGRQTGGRAGELIPRLREFVHEQTGNNPGHGPDHAEAVALDAGTLAAIEAGGAGITEERTDHIVLLAHCAGLLHDIRRRQPDHGEKGATAARKQLQQEKILDAPDIDHISFAIQHHEAFKAYTRPQSFERAIIAGSLYDADKFRWGPDNFTHTVWDMLAARPLPLEIFAEHYPRAITFIARIKKTFRTPTGRKYGPQFIDIGLDIGAELWTTIKKICPNDVRIKRG